MSREEIGSALVGLVERIGQKANDVAFTSYKHPEDRGVTVICIPTERWGEAKDALEEVFGALEEVLIQ